MIRVAITGSGNMGRMVVGAVEAQPDMEVAGIVEPRGEDLGLSEFVSGSGRIYALNSDPALLFASAQPDVVVDFTNAAWTPVLVEAALAAGVRPVIGTSGLSRELVESLQQGCESRGLGGVWAPNFAIGAVLLMHLAEIAARYFDAAEIIELHHDRKADSPSGTALETARRMRAVRGADFDHPDSSLEHIEGARAASLGGVGLHSVRLPGFVASQEVIFGGTGQTLTLRHDSLGRDSFMPGVLLAVREVMRRDSLVEGLDALIGLQG